MMRTKKEAHTIDVIVEVDAAFLPQLCVLCAFALQCAMCNVHGPFQSCDSNYVFWAWDAFFSREHVARTFVCTNLSASYQTTDVFE